LLLCRGKRSIDDLALRASEPNTLAVGSRLQAATSLNNASLYQFLVVLAHCGKQIGAWHDTISLSLVALTITMHFFSFLLSSRVAFVLT
jgi:hypothetical protein